MFDFLPTTIAGCYEVRPRVLTDHRGTFSKLFHSTTFREKGLIYSFKDADYSLYPRDAVRGLHFHPEPDALVVSCVSGSVLDVLVDMRRESSTYKKVFSTRLESSAGNMLYIPGGVAHGFLSLTNNTALITLSSSHVDATPKAGIHWSSIDFDWPVVNPVVSEEDQQLIPLADYERQFE